MLNVALLSALSYFICYGGNWIFGQSMSDRPIVIGAFTGLLLGDLYQGLIIGAALEAPQTIPQLRSLPLPLRPTLPWIQMPRWQSQRRSAS